MHAPASLVLFMAAVASSTAMVDAGEPGVYPSFPLGTLCSAAAIPCGLQDNPASDSCQSYTRPYTEFDFRHCCFGKCPDAPVLCSSAAGVSCGGSDESVSKTCRVRKSLNDFRTCCFEKCPPALNPPGNTCKNEGYTSCHSDEGASLYCNKMVKTLSGFKECCTKACSYSLTNLDCSKTRYPCDGRNEAVSDQCRNLKSFDEFESCCSRECHPQIPPPQFK